MGKVLQFQLQEMIISRALYHFMVKRPEKVLKRARKIEFEARIDKLEEILKAREYFS